MSKLTFIERFPGNDSEDECDDNERNDSDGDENLPTDLEVQIKSLKSLSTPNNNNKNDTINNSKKVSSGLQKFLQQKRTNRIEPPPDIIETKDTYLKEFHGTFIKPSNINDNDEEEDENNISSSTAQSKTELKLPKLKLFNLLFRITENELIKFGREYGYEFQNVTLGIDSTTNLPTGAAVVYLPVRTDVTECAIAINGQDCCGRPIRALSDSGYVKSRDSLGGGGNANRYFEKDISFKCDNCQLVGHKSSECSNPASKQPCHLCASFDHEASDCQNIVCFRCNQFGHHSKFCTQNYRSNTTQKPILCTICGQTNSHEKTVCPILSHKFKFEKYKSSSSNKSNNSSKNSSNGHIIYHTSQSLKRNRDDDNDNSNDDVSSTAAAMSVYKDAEYDTLKNAVYKLLEGNSSNTSSNTSGNTTKDTGEGKVSSSSSSFSGNISSNSGDNGVIEGIICMTCLLHHGTACYHSSTTGAADFSSRTSCMNGSANSSISTNSSMDISSDGNNNNSSTNHTSKKVKLFNNNNDKDNKSAGNNSMNNSKSSNKKNSNNNKLTTTAAATATTMTPTAAAAEYCPNCGCQNHHCDYPILGEYNMCNAPKYEAYQRFNRLLDELVDPQHGGAEDDQNFQLYRTLTRYQNQAVILHFPCLQKPLPLPKSSSTVSSNNINSSNNYNNSTNIASSSTVSTKSTTSNTSNSNYNNAGIIRVVHNDNASNNNNSNHNRNGNFSNYSTTSSVRNSHHVRYDNNDDDYDNDDNVYGNNYNNNNRSSYDSNYNTNNRVFNNSYNNPSSSFASLPLPVPKVQHHNNTQSHQRKFPQQQQQQQQGNASNSSYGRSVQFSR